MTEPASKRVAPTLSTRARAHLRSLAHHLEPVVQVGAEGLAESVLGAVDVALERHELIKVRFGQNFPGERRQSARELATSLAADLTQVIGRVVVLYRPRRKPDPSRPAIVLPQ